MKKKKWQAIIPLTIVMLIVLALFYWFASRPFTSPPSNQPGLFSESRHIPSQGQKPAKSNEIGPTIVDQDIDTIIKSVSADDATTATDESSDGDLVEYDSQAISDFDQTYAETEF